MSIENLIIYNKSYNTIDREFKSLYKDFYIFVVSGKNRLGVWKFWYLNGIIKFEDYYKYGDLVSKTFAILWVKEYLFIH